MICTESYVRKADAGTGGVGYEAMVVTGELVQNLGTSKFIPILRQKSSSCLLPKSVSTRFYLNFNEEQSFHEEFEKLLRELHNAPLISKPPLGKSPFAKSSPIAEAILAALVKVGSPDEIADRNLIDIHNSALEFARSNDMVGWRKLVSLAKGSIPEKLLQWRGKYERQVPRVEADLLPMAYEGVAIYSQLFCIALAGVVSSKDKFNHQASVLDEILFPKNWNLGGLTVLVHFPETAAFVFQALNGAACMFTDQLSLAVGLARTRVETASRSKSLPLFEHSKLVGWPESLGGNCKIAWDFLLGLYGRWEWLSQVYGDEDDYKASLCSYYMGLNVLELATVIASGQATKISQGNMYLQVPTICTRMERELVRKGYRLLIQDPKQVRSIWEKLSVADSSMKEYWRDWIVYSARLARCSEPFFDPFLPQLELFNDLSL